MNNQKKKKLTYIFFVLGGLYRLHGGDNVQIKRYFVSFWNGVDLRYKLLKGPKVRISIAGIIISRVSINNKNKNVRTLNLSFYAECNVGVASVYCMRALNSILQKCKSAGVHRVELRKLPISSFTSIYSLLCSRLTGSVDSMLITFGVQILYLVELLQHLQ